MPLDIRVVEKNGAVSVYRGPLLYALDIDFESTEHQPLNWTDRTPLANSEVDIKHTHDHVLEPTSPWKFAIDPQGLTTEHRKEETDPLPNPIFAKNAPPTSIWADAYPIDWPEDKGSAGIPPLDPVVDPSTKTRIALVPYGAAKLHIAEFPVAKLG